MAIEKVREYFESFGAAARIREFDVSSATVELAAQALDMALGRGGAQALGCAPERIAKTLSFLVDGGCALVVAAGDAKVDNPRFKAQFHTKAKMLTPGEVEAMVGHAVGGVCPFAVNPGVKIYLDASLRRFETVFPACGSSNSAIELTISELEQYSRFDAWVDVCKGWRAEGEG